jgi:orotidine-5'-phosphate decarboxylase
MSEERKRVRIILAWDKNTFNKTDRRLLGELSPHIDLVKVGLQAMTVYQKSGVSIAYMVACYAVQIGLKVMWDIKLDDIPQTTEGAVQNIIRMPGVTMFTIHASAGISALQSAKKAVQSSEVIPLVVTVLTSMDEIECWSIFGQKPPHKVVQFAGMAVDVGIPGIVCSPQELQFIADAGLIGAKGLKYLVVPSIRPLWTRGDDQTRSMTPSKAVKLGATHLVIGRPILDPSEGMTPLKAVLRIREEMSAA